MSENENIVAADASFNVNIIDLKKVVSQHLQALAQAGVETLPRGSGASLFDSAELMPPQSPPQHKIATATTTKPPEKVAETVIGSLTDSHAPSPAAPPRVADPTPQPVMKRPTIKASTPQPAAMGPVSLEGDVVVGDPTPYGPSLTLAQRENALAVIRDEVAACLKCKQLAASRSQTVFGVGNITPRLVFVGEAPGADEDRIGEPFVGAAGQLLDKIMVASKLKRSEVYILNTVKCRPPANRNPSQTELDHCWVYAQRQLEILKPEFICCLGSVAAKRLLNSTLPLGKLRRKFHQYRDSRVIVTYHPAYLLRTESAKKHVWEDMKMLMKEMGVDLTT